MVKKEAREKGKGAYDWKSELARDFIALGGIPFFILALIRIYLLEQPNYFARFIIAGAIFLTLTLLLKTNVYSGLGFIALIFTAIYYNDIEYNLFASLVYLGLVFSLIYLKKDKKKVFLGILFAGVASVIGYYLANLFY